MNLAKELNLNPIFCALSWRRRLRVVVYYHSGSITRKLKKDADFTIVGHVTDVSDGNKFVANDGRHPQLNCAGVG